MKAMLTLSVFSFERNVFISIAKYQCIGCDTQCYGKAGFLDIKPVGGVFSAFDPEAQSQTKLLHLPISNAIYQSISSYTQCHGKAGKQDLRPFQREVTIITKVRGNQTTE